MAQVQSGRATGPDTRRTPIVHDEALQETKRLEKIQTVASSHRFSGHSTAGAKPKTPGTSH